MDIESLIGAVGIGSDVEGELSVVYRGGVVVDAVP